MTVEDTRNAQSAAASLLDSRLVMVTGKGGTGKTTFASALAVLAAVQGRRTLLCEVDSQRPALTPIFGKEPGFDPEPVRDNLDICNVSWEAALRTFLVGLLPSRRVVKLILNNTIVSRFIDFTPGSQEIVTLSAIGDHTNTYDLVVVDMPATGHAFSLLDITRSAMGLFRSGPVYRRAGELKELLQRPGTRMVFVALPEEMVVNETIETFEKMNTFDMLSQKPVVFLNRATLPSLTDDERELVRRLGAAELTPLQEEFVRSGRWEDELEQATEASRHRLCAILDQPPVLVPPAAPGGLQSEVVQAVSVYLGRGVGVTRRDLAWT